MLSALSVAAGVVELRDGGLDRHPVRPRLPVVQLRAGDGDLAPRGDVLYEEGGQALRGDLVDRADHHPVAVGELQAPVDPGLGVRGEALRGQLPPGDHHLAVLPVHYVAVEVGVQEVVVAADALDLVVGGQQGLVVPQADVAQSGLVGLHLLPGDGLGHGEGRLLHLVQPEGPPGGLDVTFDVGALQFQLVGRHPQALHQGGVDHRAPHPDDAEDPQQAGGDPGPPHHRPRQEGQRPQQGQGQQRPQHRQQGLHVRVGGPRRGPPLGEDQSLPAQGVVPGQDQAEDRPQDGEVRSDGSPQGQVEAGPALVFVVVRRRAGLPHGAQARCGQGGLGQHQEGEVEHRRAHQGQDGAPHGPGAPGLQQGQGKDVMGHVQAEEGVALPEGAAVRQAQHRGPLGAGPPAQEKGQKDGEGGQHRRGVTRGPALILVLVLHGRQAAQDGPPAPPGQGPGQEQVPQPERGGRPGDEQEEPQPGPGDGEEDAPQPQALEPQPVHVEALGHERGHQQHDRHRAGQDEGHEPPWHPQRPLLAITFALLPPGRRLYHWTPSC